MNHIVESCLLLITFYNYTLLMVIQSPFYETWRSGACEIITPICKPLLTARYLILEPPLSEMSVPALRPFWGNSTGCRYDSVLNLSRQCWSLALNGLSPQYLADNCQLNHYRPLTISIVQCHQVWYFKNSHESGRSIIHCCWSTSQGRSLGRFVGFGRTPPPNTETVMLYKK